MSTPKNFSDLKVSVLLPTYNEAENITLLIDALIKEIPGLYEIIVVDDNSPDRTAELSRQHAATLPKGLVRVEQRMTDRGLTKSLRHGIGVSRGDVVVWMDCDFSMPPEVIPRLLRCVQQGYDIAVGSRFVRGGRFKENTQGTPDSALAVFLSRVMNYSIQFLLEHSFKDYTSGFIAARRAVLEAVPLEGNYGEYFIGLMFGALRKGFRVIELPYVCVPRQRGESKTGQTLSQYLKLGSRYVTTALRLRWNALWEPRHPLRASQVSSAHRSEAPIEIQPMLTEQIPLVSGLHHQVLFNTFNSRLGIPFLEDLYSTLLFDAWSMAWVALQEGEVIGFATATRDLAATQKHIVREVFWRDRVVAGLHILTNVRDFKDYVAHQRLVLYTRRFGKPYASILTIGVAPQAQGKGVATRLLEEIQAYYEVSRVPQYFVDTLRDNKEALALYKKNGFAPVGACAGNVILKRS